MLKKYSDVILELKQLNIPFKTKLLYLLISLGVSILIFSGIFCLLVNLLIFRDFQKIIAFGLATTLVFMFFLTDTLYYKAISQKKVLGIRIIILTDSFIFAIVAYIFVVLLIFTGVV